MSYTRGIRSAGVCIVWWQHWSTFPCYTTPIILRTARVVNRKPKVGFSVSFCRFSQPKTDFFYPVSRLPRKNKNEKPTRLLSDSFVLQRTAAKKRPKPTDISVKKRKNDRGHFHVRFTTPTAPKNRPNSTDIFGEKTNKRPNHFICGLLAVHNPGRHMIPTHAH